QRRGPAHEQVGVVLPGDGDAAVDLGVEVGTQVGGGAGEGGGHRRGVGELVAAGGRGPGGVPHGAGGQLGGDGHVGAVVLHRLERADGPAELDPLLGVGGGRVGAGAGQPDRLGREDDPGQVDEQPAGAGQYRRR